ncbi:MAG: M20/M25/M40 family metallo-hydrolase [Synergistaceae bacterium]|nr:M20/M25/M40 family metallo-hydrolase [Synergistaceae bacterium]
MKKINFALCFLLMIMLLAISARVSSAANALTTAEPPGWRELTRRFMREIELDEINSITPEERSEIHSNVDALVGDISNPTSLIGGIATAISHDSITRERKAPATYPFTVPSDMYNDYEGDRKTAKFAWAKRLSKALGFPVIVQRQPYNYIYAEFGDPDAPEMVMAFGHLDSPKASVTAANLARWRGADGKRGKDSVHYPNQYRTPYIKDNWLYGVGAQDDSGPTIATLFAAKALMDAKLPVDRRIRVVMAGYEDSGLRSPSVANTLKFMNIPYYTASPSFYDNWAYKFLNREEIPIAAFTADSHFPMIIGNSVRSNRAVHMNLAGDSKKAFRLLSGSFAVTERSGDETLKNIVHGAATLIASKAVFTIDLSRVSPASKDVFRKDLESAAAAKGWSGKVSVSKSPGPPKRLILTINTDVAMEFQMPQFSSNAIVWGMSLLSEALGAAGVKSSDLQLKKAADGIADLLFRGGVEDYIGTYMGIPPSLLRNPDNSCPNLTFAFGAVLEHGEVPVSSFYNSWTGDLSINMLSRSMHINESKYNAASVAVTNAWKSKGYSITPAPDFSKPVLYLSHNNPLTTLLFASYRASLKSDPVAFNGPYEALGLSYPQGGIGGTLAADFFNKMNAFGAVFPCDESWWHSPNERMKVKSITQMTKVLADGLLEMARYSGPAGAKFMWADIPGLNSNRADLDLLDVTVGTYNDAKSAILQAHMGDERIKLLAATSFDIPMFRTRGNQLTNDQIAAGHNPNYPGIRKGSQIYLDPSKISSKETFVLPMRLEFKAKKPDGMSSKSWNSILTGDINEIAPLISFKILIDGGAVPLTLPAGAIADMFYYKRVSDYDPDALYISVNIALKDDVYTGVETIIADSKTDLYSLSSSFRDADPFPERGGKQKRGFFVFGDGSKDARFTSPNAIFVTLEEVKL